MESKSDNISANLSQLEMFVKGLSEFVDFPKSHSVYKALVRSSLIKNYEFLRLVYLDEKFDNYFFMTSFLRGIVEDIIVLKSIHNLEDEKKERLVKGIQSLELNDRTKKQWDFFQKYRPFQPVIDRGVSIDIAKADVQVIWCDLGWNNFEVKPKSIMPPVIQLAQKLAPGILDVLYEFIYRLSSGTVHFSPQALLKMSWGNVDSENNISGTISVKHMAAYHKAFCRIYGALLFTFYFEFFPGEIESTNIEQSIVVNIRKNLLEELRWPEMVTFEEMNLSVPNAYHDQIITYGLIHQAIVEMLKDGFVNSNYQNFLEKLKLKQQ